MKSKVILSVTMMIIAMLCVIGCDATHNLSDAEINKTTSTTSTIIPTATTVVATSTTITSSSVSYTVAFYANGGIGNMTSLSVQSGQYITLPTCTFIAPKGMKFDCWNTQQDGNGVSYIDKATVLDMTTTSGVLVRLYAQWIDGGTHKIIYNNTKYANNQNPKYFKESEDISLQKIETEGYSFDGWYDDTSNDIEITGWSAGEQTDDVTLWGKWIANKYNVTLENDGEVGGDTSLIATYHSVLPSLQTKPQKTGCSFGGYWTVANGQGTQYIDASGNGCKEWDLTNDITLIGFFMEHESYQIIYNNLQGAVAPSKRTFKESESVTLTDISVSGYIFDGWYDAEVGGNKIEGWLAGTKTSNVIVYAHWTTKMITYTFNANGGMWSDGTTSNKTVSGLYGTTVCIPNFPTKDGYSCMSWNNVVPSKFNDNSDTVFTAYWTANTYTIKFDGNGADNGSMSSLIMTYDVANELTVNKYIKEDYVFLGWNTDKNAKKSLYTNEQSVINLTVLNEDIITLYAIWRYKNYLDESGDLVINGRKYSYTSFVNIIDSAVIVKGSDDNWKEYLDSSSTEIYKGVFVDGRNVKLSPYCMAQYLVTQELYETVMNAGLVYNYNSLDDRKHPVYYVSWYDAITFCNKLSIMMNKMPCYTVSGISDWSNLEYDDIPKGSNANWNATNVEMSANGYRLPTEAEWEFAVRGGDQSADDWKYAFAGIQSLKLIIRGTRESDDDYGGNNTFLQKDDNLGTVGWYSKNSTSRTTYPVGLKKGNRLNIYDMSGNLWEWCWDYWNDIVSSNDDEYTVDGVIINPLGASSDNHRVLRGGGWYFSHENYASACAVSCRNGDYPYYRNDGSGRGFRLVCTIK